MKALVVTNPFDGYELGAQITDSAKIAEVRAGENAASVVVIELPDEAPTKKSKSE